MGPPLVGTTEGTNLDAHSLNRPRLSRCSGLGARTTCCYFDPHENLLEQWMVQSVLFDGLFLFARAVALRSCFASTRKVCQIVGNARTNTIWVTLVPCWPRESLLAICLFRDYSCFATTMCGGFYVRRWKRSHGGRLTIQLQSNNHFSRLKIRRQAPAIAIAATRDPVWLSTTHGLAVLDEFAMR